MKRMNVMLSALVLLLLSACSQNEVTEVSPDAHPQVGFGVYTGVPTRGVDMTTESMKDDPTDPNKYGGFGIMGYFTGQDDFETVKNNVTPSFMHNQMVEYKNGAWTYSPVKYWPNGEHDKISFFAYAPYEDDWRNGTKAGVTVSEATVKGIPYISFQLKPEDKLDRMVDLVVADQRDKEYTSSNAGKVSFTFEHTLSRISFRAQLGAGDFAGMDGTNSFVYITHMWIVGTDHSAAGSNLSLIDPASPANAKSKFYTKAKWAELHWNYGSDAVIAGPDFSLDKMLDVENPGIEISNPTTGHNAATKGIRISSSSQGTVDKAIPLFKDKTYLYLIPVGETSGTDLVQNKGCAQGDIKIGFHYDIATKDQSNPGKFIVSHAEAFINLPAGHMKRKESYLYTLKINLRKIEISDAVVTPWTDIKNEVTVE